MTNYLMRVTAPHYCAGIIFNNGLAVHSAPIIYWMVKKQFSLQAAQNYFGRKRFKVELFPIM